VAVVVSGVEVVAAGRVVVVVVVVVELVVDTTTVVDVLVVDGDEGTEVSNIPSSSPQAAANSTITNNRTRKRLIASSLPSTPSPPNPQAYAHRMADVRPPPDPGTVDYPLLPPPGDESWRPDGIRPAWPKLRGPDDPPFDGEPGFWGAPYPWETLEESVERWGGHLEERQEG
jgi:hypothetical protein